MTPGIAIQNAHPKWQVAPRPLVGLVAGLLRDEWPQARGELGIRFVDAAEMTLLNRRWLGHEGSTDVLTFDHRDDPRGPLKGDLVVSLDDARAQAVQFGERPEAEVVRYVVHGLLHLLGHDDRDPGARRLMKREEDRIVRALRGRMSFRGLLRARRPTAA